MSAVRCLKNVEEGYREIYTEDSLRRLCAVPDDRCPGMGTRQDKKMMENAKISCCEGSDRACPKEEQKQSTSTIDEQIVASWRVTPIAGGSTC